ncbi:MAG: UDP-N-acetylglucosamine diphosphorylase [Firmicutes bacterium HGW-Firmicutes-16]|nr:MAG: UDP-N-acetylglucosamine diphosphorylase [Firmicutes bacterium HGW-Firmicutes-16]
MNKPNLKAVILAAGKGTRLQTEGNSLPKVMRIAAGKPLLAHVLSALDFIPNKDCIIVVGYQKESVIDAFSEYTFAEQKEQLGTGHAVMAAFLQLEGYNGQLIVCCGDMPLLKRETYRALIDAHNASDNVCTILSGTSELNLPYGRILRDCNGEFCGMVEDKDATPEQKNIKELNSGVYVFDAAALRSVLTELRSDNSQGEYYLTDAPLLLKQREHKVGVCFRELGYEIIGVNTPEQLRQTEEILLR